MKMIVQREVKIPDSLANLSDEITEMIFMEVFQSFFSVEVEDEDIHYFFYSLEKCYKIERLRNLILKLDYLSHLEKFFNAMHKIGRHDLGGRVINSLYRLFVNDEDILLKYFYPSKKEWLKKILKFWFCEGWDNYKKRKLVKSSEIFRSVAFNVWYLIHIISLGFAWNKDERKMLSEMFGSPNRTLWDNTLGIFIFLFRHKNYQNSAVHMFSKMQYYWCNFDISKKEPVQEKYIKLIRRNNFLLVEMLVEFIKKTNKKIKKMKLEGKSVKVKNLNIFRKSAIYILDIQLFFYPRIGWTRNIIQEIVIPYWDCAKGFMIPILHYGGSPPSEEEEEYFEIFDLIQEKCLVSIEEYSRKEECLEENIMDISTLIKIIAAMGSSLKSYCINMKSQVKSDVIEMIFPLKLSYYYFEKIFNGYEGFMLQLVQLTQKIHEEMPKYGDNAQCLSNHFFRKAFAVLSHPFFLLDPLNQSLMEIVDENVEDEERLISKQSVRELIELVFFESNFLRYMVNERSKSMIPRVFQTLCNVVLSMIYSHHFGRKCVDIVTSSCVFMKRIESLSNDSNVSHIFRSTFKSVFRKLNKIKTVGSQSYFKKMGRPMFGFSIRQGRIVEWRTVDSRKFEKFFCRTCKMELLKRKQRKKCSKCRVATYCSQKCQKMDWKKHKKICNDPRKKSEERDKFYGRGSCDD